jgi:uncharacterized protein
VSEFKAVLPKPSIDSARFWAACNEEQLLLAHCKSCAHVFYYPRLMCPNCGGRELGWRTSKGVGAVYSYSHVLTSFWGDAWQSELPYTVILVDLDEGPRMLSRLVGERREQVASGARVLVAFQSVQGQKLPFFRLFDAHVAAIT